MSKYKKPFHFKQFVMEHDKCAMKIGFDGALLAAWAQFDNPKNILDVGCGSGLMALMLRQRFLNTEITAIDPNEGAITQSEINFNNSPFEKGFNLLQTSFQDFSTLDKFDLILSNPPFFTEDTSSGDENRDQARMEKFLPIDSLLAKARSLLRPSGKFYLIYPTWESKRVMDSAQQIGLSIKTQTTIFSRKDKPSKRTIFEFGNLNGLPERKEFVSGNQDVGYSDEYKNLLKDFYTIF